tara:strand:+ start:902 stop:1180 length:279 start_codon:yes stop_codon:yes gene_type:complete
MKKIIETVFAEVLQTEIRVFQEGLLLKAARSVAPKAPTAPVSDGVANLKRSDPFISVIKNTGGVKNSLKQKEQSRLKIYLINSRAMEAPDWV